MRLKKTAPLSPSASRRRRALGAFTLAEALAALAFLAIVIPVAVEGLRVASQAGEVAHRKGLACRAADRLLNEMIVTRQYSSASGGGTVQEGPFSFRWQSRNDAWIKDAMKRLTVVVYYTVQGREYDVRLSTLVDTSMQ